MTPLFEATEGLREELALLDRVAQGLAPPTMLTWRAPRALVVPRSTARLPRFTEAAAASAREGWPVIVRESGGGIVPLAPGVLTVALAFTAPAIRIEAGFRTLCEPLVAALGDLGVDATIGWVPGAFCDGAYNVVAGGRKIAGTAQRWKKGTLPDGGRVDAVLAHAMLLVHADLGELVAAVDVFAARCGVEGAQVRQHVTLAELVPAVGALAPAEAVELLATHIARRVEGSFTT
jgi:lipoate-protein ligase A